MDLFIINRYLGEENVHLKSDESKKLNTVLQKIEKRKRKRVIENTIQCENKAIDKESINKDVIDADPGHGIALNEHIEQKQSNENHIDESDNEPENKIKKLSDNIGVDINQIEGFTVLGTDQFSTKKKVKRILPKWFLEPTVISSDLQNLKSKVRKISDLDSDLKLKLKNNGIKYLFPVQSIVIPWIIKQAKNCNVIMPQDICVSSPTGSGKTLAFALPIIQILKNQCEHKVRALIILPTQSLATQIYKIFKEYCLDTELAIALITGSRSFQDEQHQLVYKNHMWGFMSKVDIIVCTPGRLVDHLKLTEGFSLKTLQFLVIDEADRVLDQVQDDWLQHLENHLKIKDESINPSILNLLAMKKKKIYPQKLLFSATLSQDPEKIQKLSLFQPKLFTAVSSSEERSNANLDHSHFIGKYTTPKELTEKFLECPLEIKPLVLYKFLRESNLRKVLIFTNSIQNVHRLNILLNSMSEKTLKIKEISSKLNLEKRKVLMKSFADGEIDVLVCTDAMARGVDLPNVSCVISYSAPQYLKTYIHRVGRTARAGEQGLTVTMLQPNQKDKFLDMLKQNDKSNLVQVEMNEDEIESMTDIYQKALNDLKKQIKLDIKKHLLKKKKDKKSRKRSGKKKNNVGKIKQI